LISNTPPLGQDSSRQLLPGWRGVRFDQMAENITDRVDTPSEAGVEYYVGLEHLDPESLKIRRWGTPDQVEATKLRFRTGDIIFGRRRAYQRKLAVAGFDGICSAHALVLRAREEVVLADFLPFFMQSDIFFERALSISVGSLSPTINWTALAHQQFALPPLDEQRRIADILWAVDDEVQALAQCVSHLNILQGLYYKSWLNQGMTRLSWRDVCLADVCTIQSGQVDPRLSPYAEMVHIAPDDIESQTGRILEKRTATEDRVISGKYAFGTNAILYSKIRPNLQKVALPRFPGVCSADIYPVYAIDNIVTEYLFHLLLSEDFTAFAVSHSARTAIPKLNREAMLKYRFRLPSISGQKQLLRVLDLFRLAKDAIEAKSNRTWNLRRMLISQLLSRDISRSEDDVQ